MACTILSASAVAAQSPDPRLPAGTDPGGPAVALISTGIDYTVPAVAKLLARDGEGELIGWDFVDGDNRPFDVSRGTAPDNHGGDATEIVKRIGLRIVPIRVDPTDPRQLANALAFAARTPARMVVVPMWSRSREQWEPFRQAAARFPEVLLVIAAGDDGLDLDREPVWPAAFELDNAIVVNSAVRDGERIEIRGNKSTALVELSVIPADDSRRAAIGVAGVLTCESEIGRPLTGTTIKRYILERSTPNLHGGSKALFNLHRCFTGPTQF